MSKEEQAERLEERLDDPSKQWKFDPGAIFHMPHRKLWAVFSERGDQAMLECCSSPNGPRGM